MFRWFTCAYINDYQHFLVLCGIWINLQNRKRMALLCAYFMFVLFQDSCVDLLELKAPPHSPSPPHLLRPAQTNPSEKQMSSLSLLCFINFSVELSHFVAPECLLTNRGVRSLLFWLYDSVHFQLCLVKLCCDSHPLGLNGKVFGKDIIFKSSWPAVCNPFYFCKTTFHSNTACSTRSVRKVLSNSKNDSPSGHPRYCFFFHQNRFGEI